MYSDTIRECLAGRSYDPRHIEAYMRLQFSTLDHLDLPTFAHEVEIGALCVDADGIANSESLAQSFGL